MNISGTKVLLLDDDPRYLEVLCFSLESVGAVVESTTNGRKLGIHADNFGPDVIIMDVMMGEHNGILLARSFRETTGRYDIPIVFVSAWTGVGELRLPENSSMLFKPFTPGELIKVIADALRSQVVEKVKDE